MEVGPAEDIYFLNSSSLMTIPPGTKCEVEIVPKPLTILQMIIYGEEILNGKVIILYDYNRKWPHQFHLLDPYYVTLSPVGRSYVVEINIPSDALPAQLMIRIISMAVKIYFPFKLEQFAVELIPDKDLKFGTFLTRQTSGVYRVGILVDFNSAYRQDSQLAAIESVHQLRQILFFSDKSFITSADRIWEDHGGILFTNTTSVTLAADNNKDALVMVFAWDVTKGKDSFRFDAFADWRRQNFSMRKKKSGPTIMLIGKSSKFDGSLKKVQWVGLV
ncbi:hypothetical protein GCK32_007864 [Trichostrongylus colubriformis]|uniref:Uncharacterized protein n=1 Tax=Trichostrongylus colubriformis TaxID=6319 RepID=A0AAN8G5F1_TRICO